MPSPTIVELQRHLREKFPTARHGLPAEPAPARPAIDFRDPRSFPRGTITEITPPQGTSALSLLVAALLEKADDSAPLPEIALIDGNTFDPQSFPANDCLKLLWARCHSVAETLQAADLLLRDGNLPLVLLDLAAFAPAELRKIAGSSWHRLKQLCETSDSSLLALTPLPLVPCAGLRLSLQTNFRLDHLDQSREALLDRLHVTPTLQRKSAR